MNIRTVGENEHFKSAIIAIIFVAITAGLLFYINSLDIKNPALVRLYVIIIFAIICASYYIYKHKKNRKE